MAGDLLDRIEALMPETHRAEIQTIGDRLVVDGIPLDGDPTAAFELHIEGAVTRDDDYLVGEVVSALRTEPWEFNRRMTQP